MHCNMSLLPLHRAEALQPNAANLEQSLAIVNQHSSPYTKMNFGSEAGALIDSFRQNGPMEIDSYEQWPASYNAWSQRYLLSQDEAYEVQERGLQ